MAEGGERKAALDFAAKIKAAVGRKRDEEKQQAEERRKTLKKVGAALDRLFDDLEAMGKGAQVLGVERDGRSIRITLDDRFIRIASAPSDDEPDRLAIEASLVEEGLSGYFGDEIDRWALRIEYPEQERRKAYTQVYALLGMGMSWLVEHGLDLDL